MSHHIDIQPRFTDFDMFRHITNSAYMQYLDLAKAMFFNDILGETFSPEAVSSAIVNINIDFMAPTRPGEHVAVHTVCSRLGNRSFALCQEIFNPETNSVKCKAVTTLAGFDINKQQSADIPKPLRQALAKLIDEKA